MHWRHGIVRLHPLFDLSAHIRNATSKNWNCLYSKLCYYSGSRELPSFIVSYVNFYRIGVDIMSLSFIAKLQSKEKKFITPPSRQPTPSVNSIMFQSSWEGLTDRPTYSIILKSWPSTKIMHSKGIKTPFFSFYKHKCKKKKKKTFFKNKHVHILNDSLAVGEKYWY